MVGRSRKTRRGGAVYEGQDACVFVPALKSKGEGLLGLSKYTRSNTKYITKIFAQTPGVLNDKSRNLKQELEDEKTGYDIMKSVDPRGEFTRTFYDVTAVPDLKSILPTEHCMKDLSDESPGMYIEYGGVSIHSLDSQGKLSMYIKPILQGLKNMSNLFLKMSKKGINHGDVHEGNILFDKTTERVYLIDFSRIRTREKDGEGGLDDDPPRFNKNRDMIKLIDLIQWILVMIQHKTNKTCNDMIERFNNTAKRAKSSLDIQIMYNFINDFIPSLLNFCSADGAISRTSSDGKSSAASPPRLESDGSRGSSRRRRTKRIYKH
jgi:serine/threonine protein kinase